MNPLAAQRSFAAYGASHWIVLIVLAVGVLVLAVLGSRYRGTPAVRTVGRVLALVLVAFHVPILVYDLSPARFDIEHSLPFQISDLAWMAAAYALWSQRHWAYALTYYWGLTLVPQALITPALEGPEALSIDFVSFWGQHLLVVWAAVYLTWWAGMRPTWRGFAIAAAVTVAWGLAMLAFNEAAGTNYLFVSRRPDNPSLLDLMGEWPWYLGVELVVGLGAWALLTWPWTRSATHRSATSS
ncbi:TIGR02206 family membrane protein [Pseudonocardia sp. DSM 110487]|uniref:YwaF family protein n=1 Tax=Pseudonocardia sp. DSM 110487 TaxID=2865833 RepID=UPI001C69E8A8|nr:TIGR02206 family membrane protein [Pseudonocardia sp. DSM 110487]QYN37834.1 TIGR02206 family membrane protein [Pseudonocardia sp. DSM 110487]